MLEVIVAARSRPSTKTLPPLPPEFAAEFIKGGWRQVERIYGARTDLLVAWRVVAGGERLERARREYMAGRLSIGEALSGLGEAWLAR